MVCIYDGKFLTYSVKNRANMGVVIRLCKNEDRIDYSV